MKRVISKFGAYTAHLTALSTDSSVKSVDQSKFQGYLRKWTDAKYVLGCAFFVDLLTSCSIFSKSMQADDLDILAALDCLIRALKEINKLHSMPLSEWPTYSTTINRIQLDEEGEYTYQGQVLSCFSAAQTHYDTFYQEYCQAIIEKIRVRLSWSDLQLLHDIIFVLATQGWQKVWEDYEAIASERGSTLLKPIDRLIDRFKFPLEKSGVLVMEIKEEFISLLSYANQFISLSTMEYQAVWWRLFHSPNSSEWLSLAKLLLSLPVSNGKIERNFSQVNLIKNYKRSSLSIDTLNDLLMLNIDKLPLEELEVDEAIDMWWHAKQRRPTHQKRKKYKKRTSIVPLPYDSDTSSTTGITTSSPEEEEEEEEEESAEEPKLLFDDWDEWIMNYSN